ncbi:MAG: flagellar biosynthetic protein FliR [Kofleriaceae bacterium]|nr:flagellar biosynthetic protein FliR [Kofleriaceae bacterium]
MDPGTPLVVALVALRLVPMAMVPVWGGPLAPWSTRVALAALGAVALAVLQPPAAAATIATLPAAALVAIGLKELAIGAVLALVVAVPFIAADMAGRLMGGAVGGALDGDAAGPGGPTSTGGLLVGLLAVLVFFAVDGHLIVVTALAGSYRVLPLLGGLDRVGATHQVLAAVAALFAAGVALAAPALVAAALVEVALGLIGRAWGGAAARLTALRGAAVLAFVAAGLWVLAIALADGGGAAARSLDGAVRALAP